MSAEKTKGRLAVSEASQWLGSIRVSKSHCLARGQAMVEMAFVLPLFLFFVFGIIEIGRAWSVKQVMTHAAREGARIMMLPSGNGYAYADRDAVKAAAQQAVEDYLHFAGLSAGTQVTIKVEDVDLMQSGPGYTDLHKATINITHDFDTPLPVILMKGSSPIKMGVTSIVEIE